MPSHRAPKLATRKTSAFAIAGMAAGSVLLMQGSAHAETTQQALADYHQKMAQSEAATEAYNSAAAQEAALQTKINSLQAQIATDSASIAKLQTAMGMQAAQQYRDSGMSESLRLALNASPETYLNEALVNNEVSQQDAQAIKQLQAAQAQVAADRKLAENELAQQQQAVAQKASDKAKAQQEAQSAKQLYSSLNSAAQAAINSANQGVSPSTVTTTTATGEGPRHAEAVAYAKSKLGDEYVYAGAGPSVYDCSGLTMMAWEAAGVSIPHNAAAQSDMMTHVSAADIVPGDLVFYTYGDGITHVGIYVGGGIVEHAPHTGTVVQYGDMYTIGTVVDIGDPNPGA